MGKSTARDTHDSDDDELQRFSKWGATRCCRVEDRAMGREYGEHKCDEVRCRCATKGDADVKLEAL
jgi:hypothetical protein